MQYNRDHLKAVIKVLTWLDENLVEGHPLWEFTPAIDLEEPESNDFLGQAVFHVDGYWVFEPGRK